MLRFPSRLCLTLAEVVTVQHYGLILGLGKKILVVPLLGALGNNQRTVADIKGWKDKFAFAVDLGDFKASFGQLLLQTRSLNGCTGSLLVLVKFKGCFL